MLELIQPAIRDRAEALAREFQSATPFRHIVMDEFFTPDFCQELLAAFPGFDRGQSRNELGAQGRKAVNPDLPQIGPSYARLDALLKSREFLQLMSKITGIPDLLYDPKYVGGGTHENLDGQDLDPHVDFNYHPITHLHRRLNLIVFLNPEWQLEWGGALEFEANPWNPEEQAPPRVVVPSLNRAVVFETSEVSWHGFKRIHLPPDKKDLSRRSIAVYYYTRFRPEAETAGDHSTVYVPRPLPEQIRAGHTLNQEDVDAVRELIARRDMLLRFLYEREKEISPYVRATIHSKAFRLYSLLIRPVQIPWSWWKTRHLRQ